MGIDWDPWQQKKEKKRSRPTSVDSGEAADQKKKSTGQQPRFQKRSGETRSPVLRLKKIDLRTNPRKKREARPRNLPRGMLSEETRRRERGGKRDVIEPKSRNREVKEPLRKERTNLWGVSGGNRGKKRTAPREERPCPNEQTRKKGTKKKN